MGAQDYRFTASAISTAEVARVDASSITEMGRRELILPRAQRRRARCRAVHSRDPRNLDSGDLQQQEERIRKEARTQEEEERDGGPLTLTQRLEHKSQTPLRTMQHHDWPGAPRRPRRPLTRPDRAAGAPTLYPVPWPGLPVTPGPAAPYGPTPARSCHRGCSCPRQHRDAPAIQSCVAQEGRRQAEGTAAVEAGGGHGGGRA
ncbi:unnamed protein product [Urochloa humidicola]